MRISISDNDAYAPVRARGRGGLVVAFVTAGVTSSLSGRTHGSEVVPTGISPHTGGRGQGGESTMEATRTKSGAGFTQSWRELAHTPTHQVPVLLGAVRSEERRVGKEGRPR